MNCPNCGRPITATANICPKCKTKIFHNPENDENLNEDGSPKTVSLDGRPLKRNHSVLKSILLVLVIIILLAVLCCILIPERVVGLVEDVSWLEWLVKLLES